MKTKIYVECIEKLLRTEFTTTNITVGKVYPVKWIDNDDYQIEDDKGEIRYYRQKFFTDAEWQEETPKSN